MNSSAQRVWVIGLGITGLSCVRYLLRQGMKPEQVKVWDTRLNPPGQEQLKAEFPEVALTTGPLKAEPLCQAQTLVVSPGVAVATPAIQAAQDAGIEIIGDIELFARAVDAPLVVITGSNGKSTVTSLLGEMAHDAQVNVGVGGNIGTPALDLLGQGHNLYILELSSFQLETSPSLAPTIATVLNVSADHLDRYRDFNHYRDTKLSIYAQAQQCLFNAEDGNTQTSVLGHKLSFTLQSPQNDQQYGLAAGYLCRGQTRLMAADQVAMQGRHNLANALAAWALGAAVGLPETAMIKALGRYTGMAHRCELIAIKGGVRYINDSKATNIGATEAALAGFGHDSGRLFLLAGGDAKGAELTELAPALTVVHQLLAFGQDGHQFCDFFENTQLVSDLDQALAHASELAVAGDTVLLSPACSSLDSFKNFMARGDRFRDLVEALQ